LSDTRSGVILILATGASFLISTPGLTNSSSITPDTRGLISISRRGTIAPVATVLRMMSTVTVVSVS
jgi:hypothetical protein